MEDNPTNVTAIGGARKGKSKPKAEGGGVWKPKQAEFYRAISDVIRRLPSLLPAFPTPTIAIEMELGAHVPATVEDDVVTIISREALAMRIQTYCETLANPSYIFTAKQLRDIADLFLMSAVPVSAASIASVSWSDEPGLTYRRLPWAKNSDWTAYDAPTWEKLLARMSNAQAFIEWVGSLFFEDAQSHNYVWLFGDGNDGKGSLNRFLELVFGPAYRAKQPPIGRDKFWTYGLLGARLVTFAECDDHTFVASALFKSLTGGDSVDVEAKGQMSFTARLKARFLILSNSKPTLSSGKANLRRIIYCEMAKNATEFDHEFEDRLWDEGGAFLSLCIRQYADKYPKHGHIRSDHEDIENWIATLEEPFEIACDALFDVEPAASITAAEMNAALGRYWDKHPQGMRLAFLRWLEKTHGIKKRRIGGGPMRPRVWLGANLRAAFTGVTPRGDAPGRFGED